MKLLILLLLTTIQISYASIVKSPIINYEGPITTNKIRQVMLFIYTNKDKFYEKNITIIINSSGGQSDAAFQLMDFFDLMRSKNYKINIIVNNLCASACFSIFQYADYKAITNGSVLMTHRSFYIIGYPFLDLRVRNNDSFQIDLDFAIKECSKLEKKEYFKDNCIAKILYLKDCETYFFIAEDMQYMGLVDFIIKE